MREIGTPSRLTNPRAWLILRNRRATVSALFQQRNTGEIAMKKEELTMDTKKIYVELRSAMKGVTDSDGWLLATVDGGIDKMKIRQRQTKSGLKTTIEFTSLGGGLLTDNYDRVKRRRETAAHRLEAAKAIPG
jgi:hypothetical protein